MRLKCIYFLGLTVLALSFRPSSRAQESPDRKAHAMVPAAPTSGFRAEFLEEISYYEQRYTRLAEAMPAEKYTWRPAEGVRSVGEVFTHITAANYGIARALGTAPPAGLDFKAITGLSGDKPKVLQAMKDSFAHFRSAITGHFGEHLGQSIAYARMNGVVPPWTEEMQQQQQKPADKPKP